MTYTAPDRHNVNLKLKDYDVPSLTEVNFEHYTILDLFESLNLSDTLSRELQILLKENLNLDYKKIDNINKTLTELINIEDTLELRIPVLLLLTESIGLEDRVKSDLQATLIENLKLNDELIYLAFRKLLLSENINLEDKIEYKIFINLIENLNIQDKITENVLMNLIEKLELSDELDFKIDIELIENLTVNDSEVLLFSTKFLTLIENLNLSDEYQERIRRLFKPVIRRIMYKKPRGKTR